MSYRKIWEKINGKIPIDEKGRSYEIHHIDGNRKNNKIENLICVTIEEHYEIHLKNGEIHSANLIANRFNKPLLQGHHCSDLVKHKISTTKKGKKISDLHKQKMSESKKGKYFSDLHKLNLKKGKNILTCPKCGITGGSNSMKRFHFDNCGKKYIMKKELCPHCGLESTKNILTRWHFANCKFKK